jgi:hypothetical protein
VLSCEDADSFAFREMLLNLDCCCSYTNILLHVPVLENDPYRYNPKLKETETERNPRTKEKRDKPPLQSLSKACFLPFKKEPPHNPTHHQLSSASS